MKLPSEDRLKTEMVIWRFWSSDGVQTVFYRKWDVKLPFLHRSGMIHSFYTVEWDDTQFLHPVKWDAPNSITPIVK